MEKHENDSYMTISEFSRISEIKRKSLIFYDNTGVFSPKYTAPNGYRYYTHDQIYVISVINVLKELGMPLSEIKEYTSDITPENAISLLREQEIKLNDKIEELRSIQDMLGIKLRKLEEGVSSKTGIVQIQYFDETPVLLSDSFSADRHHIPDDIWLDFYMKCKQQHISFGYPEGYLIGMENLFQAQTSIVSNIIAYVHDGKYANSTIPAGDYVIAYGAGGLEDTKEIYDRIFTFIKENNYRITGDAYEERLIDEVGSSRKDCQMIRVRVRVSTEKN